MSNCSNKEAILVELKGSLRDFVGGYFAKRSLRGGFVAHQKELVEELKDSDFFDANVIRECPNKLPIDALAESNPLTPIVRMRWFGDFFVETWASRFAGRTRLVLKKMLDEETGHTMRALADDEIADDPEMQNVDAADIGPFPVAPVDDGMLLGEQLNAEAPQALVAQENVEPNRPEVAPLLDDQEASTRTDRAKTQRLLAAVEKYLSNREAATHWREVRSFLFGFHLLHLRYTFGQQYHDGFGDKEQEVLREFPELAVTTGHHAFLLNASKLLPDILEKAIADSFHMMWNKDQLVRSWKFVTLVARFLLYELYDPDFNLWNTILLRDNKLHPRAVRVYPKMFDDLKRDLSEVAKHMVYNLKHTVEEITTLQKMCRRAIMGGPTSDSEIEVPWASVTTADGRMRALENKFRLSFKVLESLYRSKLYHLIPPIGGADYEKMIDVEEIRPVLERAIDVNKFKKVLNDMHGEVKSRDDLFKKAEDMKLSDCKSAAMTPMFDEAKRQAKSESLCVHPTNYYIPGMEVLAYMSFQDHSPGDDFAVGYQIGKIVDDNMRFRHWRKRGVPFCLFDHLTEKWTMVVEVGGIWSGWLMRMNKELKVLELVEEKGRRQLMAGLTSMCGVIMDYDAITFKNGRVQVSYRKPILDFTDAALECVDAFPVSLLGPAIEWFSEMKLGVQSYPPEQKLRDALRKVLQCDDTREIKKILEELLQGVVEDFGCIEPMRKKRRVVAGDGNPSADQAADRAARRRLGFVQNPVYWEASCPLCHSILFRTHKSERRANSQGRHLYCRWTKALNFSKDDKNKPQASTFWAQQEDPIEIINSIFCPPIINYHKETLCPNVATLVVKEMKRNIPNAAGGELGEESSPSRSRQLEASNLFDEDMAGAPAEENLEASGLLLD
ncbi:unnamed protein product [Amoebophrya sp. A25]|nr:unnamed protein product [Amoebophrya sp. A25]|eukprot:GSA25T00019941001.1